MQGNQSHASILIADDDPGDRQLIEKSLKQNNLANPRHYVGDGVELMNFLNNKDKYADKAQYPLPGIIFLDLNMPKMDGREALHEIKGDERLKSIPVIVMTNSTAEEDIIRSYNLGVNSFVKKPLTFNGLVQVVKGLAEFWFDIATLPGKK